MQCVRDTIAGLGLAGAATSVGFAILLAASPGSASEWANWRGPNHDGVSDETGLISSWSPEGENLIWKADFIGRSTPVVIDGRACVIGRVGDGVGKQEVVACYDAGSGEKLWEHKFNVYLTTVPFNRVGWASMAADLETGYVYAHGVGGPLIAYDADGTIVWQHSLAEQFGRLSGYGGRTQTPIVDGDLLIINFVSVGWGELGPLRHRYFAFDKKTGELIWVSTPGKVAADFNTQSGPVAVDLGGRRTLIAGNADGSINALDMATGEKIWSFQLSKRGINSTVLFHDGVVYASHSEENIDSGVMGRVVAIDATGKGDVTESHELWRIEELGAGFPSPTFKDGRLYVVDNSANLYSIDGKTGEIKWTHPLGTVGKGSPVWADGKLYVTETNGHFHIIKPGADGAESLDTDKLHVADGRYAEIYGSPAIAYGRIYFATEGGVYCLGDKGKPFSVTRSKAKPAARGSGEPVKLQVVPWEVQLDAGQSVDYRVRLLDAQGRVLDEQPAQWTLEGLQGEIDGDGKYRSGGSGFQTGKIVAKVGELSGYARVRVYPPLPWSFDFEDLEPGKVPGNWIGANRIYQAGERDGRKVFIKEPRERGLNRTYLYMGTPWLDNYTIEAEVYGTAERRKRPDLGLINSGYILDVKTAHGLVELRTWTAELRIHETVDFTWEPDTWYRLKLRVDSGRDKAVIRGKVWKSAEPEPAEWTVTAEDPLPIASGTPGLLAYSPVELFYDNIKITPNQ